MRKLFTVILGISILACLSIFAERTMYVKHKTAGVMSFKVSAKDSLYFWNTVADKDADESELMMYVRTANNGLKSIPYKQVDSIYFSKTESSVVDEKDYIKDGALIKAAFKVSDTKSVYFSQGNLQFNAMQGTHKTADENAKGTWRFAENQYDVIGKANKNVDSTYNGWIDLFCWGSSGAVCQPWEKKSSITRFTANEDWGVYNAISNGGNEPNKWRTLTTSEWEYLYQNNKWTLGYIWGKGYCFMLIPETFTAPEGIIVEVIGSGADINTWRDVAVPTNNKYTTEQFASLEKLGVVALPCGGYRSGTSVRDVVTDGYYWSSSSAAGSDYAYVFYYDSPRVSSSYSSRYRYYGGSVRLVQDVQ